LVVALTWVSARSADEDAGRAGAAKLALVPAVAGWVDRAELAELVSALTSGDSSPVALTTGLTGAGGFGKTTLAARACSDRSVRERFGGGIVWVTVGQDADGPRLAARIAEVIAAQGTGGQAFTSAEQAGRALSMALAGRGLVLLVADDVWTAAQLEPFTAEGRPWRLLVTTRRPQILDNLAAKRIWIDAMPGPAARQLLTRGLPVMDSGLERELLELTGRWPLLLNLVNRRLARDISRGAAIGSAAADAAGRLRAGGPAALDVADSGQRETAVAATVGYSLDVLTPKERDRFLELGVFAEDAEIPLPVAGLLWQGAAGLASAEAASLCDRLDGLSLLTMAWAGDVRVLVLHDVIRDFALSRLGPGGTKAAHAVLVGAARGILPAGESGVPGWWRLPETPELAYLWSYLTYHLDAAGLAGELNATCCDLRFLSVQLRRSGPAAVEADLARCGSPAAGRLRRAVAQNAHLLSPIEPRDALITILTSRLGGVPEAEAQLPALRAGLDAWTAWPAWPVPDQPADALIRVITGHKDWLSGVAIAPDGTWLASAGVDGTVRTWNADGAPGAELACHAGPVNAVAIALDGTWLATASYGTVRTWNAGGAPRAVLAGHPGPVNAVAIAPGGTWLATGGEDGTVRTWAPDGAPRAVLAGHTGPVNAVAIAPDGTWLATASNDETVRTWNAGGAARSVLAGHQSWVSDVAIAPDGTWLATAGYDQMVRTWAADGTPRAVLAGHKSQVLGVAIAPDGTWLATASWAGEVRTWAADGTSSADLAERQDWVNDVAIAPDGTWLATAGNDLTVRIWNADGTPRTVLAGHTQRVTAVAIAPEGTWLATAGNDLTVRTWAADGSPRTVIAGHSAAVLGVAIAPDGTWLATASVDGTVQTWNADGTPRADLAGHTDAVNAVAIAPDGTWLATASRDGTVRTWNADGTPRADLAGHTDAVNAVAIAPDGTWLATGSDDLMVRTWTPDGTPRADLAGHTSQVRGLAITPDGTWLASASWNGEVRTWAANGTPRAATAIRTDGVASGCAWFPVGTDLCIAGQHGLYKFSLQPPSG
jgi:WD40 repeat protein